MGLISLGLIHVIPSNDIDIDFYCIITNKWTISSKKVIKKGRVIGLVRSVFFLHKYICIGVMFKFESNENVLKMY